MKALPDDLALVLTLCPTPADALEKSNVLVVSTEWPEYLSIEAKTVVGKMKEPIVIDANRFLVKTLGSEPRIGYIAVGKPQP